jgi:hypothetical protein
MQSEKPSELSGWNANVAIARAIQHLLKNLTRAGIQKQQL